MTKSKTLDNRQVTEKALIVLFGFLASGLLGFVRTAVVAGQFGAGAALDTFLAAQRIPELIFALVAGGALSSSFIPIYAKYRHQNQRQAWQLASAAMTLTAAAAALLGSLVALFAPQLVSGILLPSRPPEQQQLAIAMVRLMMLTPFIFSISGLVMGILQSHAAFWLPAIAVGMNHIGIMFGALMIAPLLPAHPNVGQVGALNVMGLAYGALLSAILHLAVQLPGLRRLDAALRPLLSWRIAGVTDVLKLMGPRILGLAVVQVNFLVSVNLASNMADGSLVALNTAFKLIFVAVGIIGQSVGSAVFPTLSTLWAQRDYAGFTERLATAMRNILYLSFPATVMFILLGEPIVSLFERGEWTAESTQATAWALTFYAIGIAGFTLLEVLSRAFYALEDSRTPVAIGILAMFANIILNLVFIQWIGAPTNLARGAFAGLALANAVTTIVESLALWWLMRRRLAKVSAAIDLRDSTVLRSAGGTLLLSLVMAMGLWMTARLMPTSGWPVAAVGLVVGAIIFFGGGWLFDLGETRSLLRPLFQQAMRRRGSR